MTGAKHLFINPDCTPGPLNTWSFDTQYNDVENNYGKPLLHTCLVGAIGPGQGELEGLVPACVC